MDNPYSAPVLTPELLKEERQRQARWQSVAYALGRMLVGLSVVCLICVAPEGFPLRLADLGMRVSFFVPALVIAVVLTALSTRQNWTFSMAMLGGVLGFILAPSVSRSPSRFSWVDRYVLEFVEAVPLSAACALLMGGVVLMFEVANRRRRTPQVTNDK